MMKPTVNKKNVLMIIVLLFQVVSVLNAYPLHIGKFTPGHYIAVGRKFEINEIGYIENNAIIGVNKRYFWSDLEPEENRYDFSDIENDIQTLRKLNKKLVVFFIDRSFTQRRAMPTYLSEYEILASDSGYIPIRWSEKYQERYQLLIEEMGRRFDLSETFEGIAIQESSLGLSKEDRNKYNYSVKKYENALVKMLHTTRKALPTSNVFWYGNFIDNDQSNGKSIKRIANQVKEYQIIWGVPDILPFHKGYNNFSYPLFKLYENQFIFFACAQDDSYRTYKNDFSHEVEEPLPQEGYTSMYDIFLFARNELKVKYIFWNYFYDEAIGKQNTFDDAIKVIDKYPQF